MTDKVDPIWWIELIKVSPGLITVTLAVGVIIAFRNEVRALLSRTTKLKALGLEAEFDVKALDNAIAAQAVKVSNEDKKGALKRLHTVGPLLRDARILWIDDNQASTRNEQALLEGYGARITTVTTSAAAEGELRHHVYTMVVTDLKREGKETEGLTFINYIVKENIYRWTIAYVGTDQWGKSRPPYLFAITNRPDHLIHYVCDVIERERL